MWSIKDIHVTNDVIYCTNSKLLHAVSVVVAGSHRVDITYNGQPLRGSPFIVDIFDPSKIRVQGATSGTVKQLVQFDGKNSGQSYYKTTSLLF